MPARRAKRRTTGSTDPVDMRPRDPARAPNGPTDSRDTTAGGRGMFRLLQRSRTEPSEDTAPGQAGARAERDGGRVGRGPRPSERGASRGRRIAWSLGALGAAGAGAYWWTRRRASRREERSRLRRY